jgi:hypothetical protein
MNSSLRNTLRSIAFAAAGFAAIPNAHAWQNIASANAAFDAQFNARLGAMQQQNNNAMQQLWQTHLRVNGPRMQAQYRQLVASGQAVGTYEQFAYWDLMSARGTNNAGARAAQIAQYEGNRQANATVQQGHASYNSGYYANSARTSAVMGRMSDANRGNGAYVDAAGNSLKLPQSLPYGQTVTVNGYTYAQDQQGNYYRHEGQGYWSRVQGSR